VIETHRSFVNRWECDENSHMNVQFYFKRFDEAARILKALHPDAGPVEPVLRHVRYHRELDEGDSTIIRTGVISGGDFDGRTVHVMTNAQTGAVCTTALDTLEGGKSLNQADADDGQEIMAIPAGILEAALPRGLGGGPITIHPADELLDSGKALVTHFSTVEDNEINGNNQLITNRIISRFTDGAPHAWDHGGITTSWLRANNFGRVAVEMKVMRLAESRPGTALRLISHLEDVHGKTFRILHQLQAIGSGTIVALGEVRCLVMDLEKRRAVALPEIRAAG
jgi:acyl-CoA thioester hydrolase